MKPKERELVNALRYYLRGEGSWKKKQEEEERKRKEKERRQKESRELRQELKKIRNEMEELEARIQKSWHLTLMKKITWPIKRIIQKRKRQTRKAAIKDVKNEEVSTPMIVLISSTIKEVLKENIDCLVSSSIEEVQKENIDVDVDESPFHFQLFESNNQIEIIEGYTPIEVHDKDVDISDKVNIDDELVEGNDSVEIDDEVENQGVVVKEWKESPRQFERQGQDFMNNVDTNQFFFVKEFFIMFIPSRNQENKIRRGSTFPLTIKITQAGG
ncbi:uncharacterized protein LOC131858223 [Cryptomeria japonica]|uniref:uncharacterized protein LOC131858223 n=1 Tax=Cryptomeria japonica TaxID=3369 RepID=UPI0027DA2A49|nr:uncharacterized protein LOC131858223 [Cryptomeria japonica]